MVSAGKPGQQTRPDILSAVQQYIRMKGSLHLTNGSAKPLLLSNIYGVLRGPKRRRFLRTRRWRGKCNATRFIFAGRSAAPLQPGDLEHLHDDFLGAFQITKTGQLKRTMPGAMHIDKLNNIHKGLHSEKASILTNVARQAKGKETAIPMPVDIDAKENRWDYETFLSGLYHSSVEATRCNPRAFTVPDSKKVPYECSGSIRSPNPVSLYVFPPQCHGCSLMQSVNKGLKSSPGLGSVSE